ncbi:MAG: FtsW/RodA/SpoVE family cell cycle protein [Planctomycetota bacterium]|jgi:cell division protein FtsW
MIAENTLTNESHSRLADYIAVVIVFLMGLGAVMVFSAGSNLSYELDLSRFYDFPGLRQILFFPLAVVVLLVASCVDYRWLRLHQTWWKSPVLWLLVVAIALLVLVLVPQLGTAVKGARRWLRISVGPASVSFQPSELAKWTIVFVLAAVCSRLGLDIRRYWTRFLPLCLLIGLVCGLIVIEDFGTAAFIALISFVILIVAGVRWWHVMTLLPVGMAGFMAALIRSPHRLKRLQAFLDPEQWGDTVAYQANQSLMAIGSGGVWGKGLGEGVTKYGHLPEDMTDFVFAIVGEELGLVGTLAVIMLFIFFLSLGLVVALRCQDRFGRLAASGIVLAIGIQAALNIGVVTVVLPTKGIPLPFISAGGTSMLLSAAAVGVLLNIASQTDKVPDSPTPPAPRD